MKKKLPFRNPEIVRALTAADFYQIKYILLLVSIPLLCGTLLLLLFYVFAELNLYYLEANGLILDEQIREGYFQQLGIETFSVIGYLGLQLLATFVAAVVVMRWAAAPFAAASEAMKAALENKASGRHALSRWLSESPSFEKQISQFSQNVRQGKKQATAKPQAFATNYPFLLKFVLMFGILSLCTGYVMSIILDSVYTRIVALALQTVKANQFVGHYFVAQQEILQKANNFTVGLSILLYFLVGLQISRYMGTMIFVFSRAIHEDRFPITLRSTDIYTDLADSLNEGRNRLK
jgi:hypothetical protein